MERPDFFTLKNGDKAKLPFTDQEYQSRLSNLRIVMSKNNHDMIILTSMHNIAYYTGFIYCSFGRPYGCVVTDNKISLINIVVGIKTNECVEVFKSMNGEIHNNTDNINDLKAEIDPKFNLLEQRIQELEMLIKEEARNK